MTDIKKALLDPAKVFGDPSDVVSDLELTRDQKIEIKRRWEFDAHELEVAEEEAEEEAGMSILHPEMFDRIVKALHTLGAERDTEHPAHKIAACCNPEWTSCFNLSARSS